MINTDVGEKCLLAKNLFVEKLWPTYSSQSVVNHDSWCCWNVRWWNIMSVNMYEIVCLYYHQLPLQHTIAFLSSSTVLVQHTASLTSRKFNTNSISLIRFYQHHCSRNCYTDTDKSPWKLGPKVTVDTVNHLDRLSPMQCYQGPTMGKKIHWLEYLFLFQKLILFHWFWSD